MPSKSQSAQASRDACGPDVLSGGGEMGERIRVFDWSKTPVGPVKQWPQSLKTAVRILLGSRYPMFVWWGESMLNFYNDAYAPMLGNRHPQALGQSARDTWSDVWDVVGPQAELVLRKGVSTWNDETLLVMTRYGYTEETYFTFSYSPAPDDNGNVAGVFCAVSEETQKVISRRRMRTLRELAARTVSAKTAEEACALAAQTLGDNPHDLPFALVYVLAPDGKSARLAGASGVRLGVAASPREVALELLRDGPGHWPLEELLTTRRAVPVTDLPTRFGPLPGGPWPEPTTSVMLLPLSQPGKGQLSGFVIAGISPRRRLDDEYKGFLELVAGQVSTGIANARAYEEARQRAEALAELDRAKTAFFSNVSHEFRTPLTLMLGPVEELLANSHTGLSPAAKGQLELVNRNGLRLLRLVNTLLDFSRIEAGRVQAVFEPTDLCAFTAELASVFRAATDRAGLALRVDCAPLAEPVYVDRDMWEKVVLNLLSNAFKFTFEGEIEVSLRAREGWAELRVRDTGVGIPAEAMPRLFERFHRVPTTRSRTHEGSGIGLALVQELIKLHGGSVHAESAPAVGSTFVVRIPLGHDHLPPEQLGGRRQLASTAVGAAPFVEEAMRWLPDALPSLEDVESASPVEPLPVPCPPVLTGKDRPRLLLADDNADMRQYLARLLGERYEVQAVPDGAAALAAARERRPDLILSDVMMPHLDGFGLVQALRADAALQTVPVILLSARAGEESRVEGLQHGADDYLIKPFSARELLARVAAHLDMAQLRKEKEEALARSKEELERLVAERTAKLQEMVAELEHFSYTITHDMRAPLRAMRGFAEVLQKLSAQGALDEQQVFLQRIITGAARMDALIIDALNYSRAVRQELTLAPVDIGKLLAGMLESYPGFQPAHAHIRLEGKLPVVLGNEAGLTQCFSNLLGNAVKFVKPGQKAEVRIWAEPRPGWVRLWVEDQGLGIPASMLPRVFDMFSRGQSAQEGTGIGLALVRKVVDRMGGRVGVESELGSGSRFWVELKAVDGGATAGDA